jgi:ABC-type lipoprotein export system ATPase subunit
MLTARQVSKVYTSGGRGLVVLKDIDLAIAEGEVVGIVGPSGAGKSTLLHILGGLDEPTTGTVHLDEACLSRWGDVEKASARNRRFGFVFQFYHLLGEFSACENVMMPLLLDARLKPREARPRAEALLDLVGLADRRHHRPTELSGGEQQRVAIARALINDPQFLFCDEPTGNLDHASGRQVGELLLRLHREKGMTLIIVTHSREMAAGAGRVIHLLDGQIVEAAAAIKGFS